LGREGGGRRGLEGGEFLRGGKRSVGEGPGECLNLPEGVALFAGAVLERGFRAFDLADNGTMTGWYGSSWSQGIVVDGGGMEFLTDPNGQDASPRAVSDNGQWIVGTMSGPDSYLNPRTVYWTADGGGGWNPVAVDQYKTYNVTVNNAGLAAGTGENEPRAFDPRRELAVVLAGSPSAEPKGCDYAIDGGDLAPRTMVVRPSVPFRIENRSPADHELHAPGVSELAPLQTAPGNARTASIPRPGTYEVRDRLFPHLRGHLVVTDDLVACAEVAADGSYAFADVMPGTYTLRVYRNGEVVAEQATEVATRNLTLDVITPEIRAQK